MRRTQSNAETHGERSRGFIARWFYRTVSMLGWLLGAMVMAVLLEWLGMTLIWPELEAEHSRAMVRSELVALNRTIVDDAYAAERVHNIAINLSQAFHKNIIQASGVHTTITTLATWWGTRKAMVYAEAALNSLQAFSLRLVVVLLTLPVYLLLTLWCTTEGLVRRALRRYGGGHETAYLFHHAKRLVWPSLLIPVVVYLSLPVAVSPLTVFGPGVALYAISLAAMVSKFKKFL